MPNVYARNMNRFQYGIARHRTSNDDAVSFREHMQSFSSLREISQINYYTRALPVFRNDSCYQLARPRISGNTKSRHINYFSRQIKAE